MRDYFVRLLNGLCKHPLLSVFFLALLVRLLVAGTVVAFFKGSLFLDDHTYLELVRAHNLKGVQPGDGLFWNSNRGFLEPVAFISKVLGELPLVTHLVPAVAGSVTAVAVTALLKRHTTSAVALGGGSLAAILPSQVLWSSLLLKDSLIWMSLSLTALALAWWSDREAARDFAIGAIAMTGLVGYLSTLRLHTLVVCCIAVAAATGWRRGYWRIQFMAVAAALLLVVPWLAGAGVAGIDILRLGASGLEQQRQAAAVGGASAFGNSVTIEAVRDILYLPTGLRIMLIDPLPIHLDQSAGVLLAFFENLVWYPIMVLAIYGVPVVRQRSPELIFTLLMLVGLATMWALVEGNFGTAFRHRGEFVWATLVLAGIGADRLLSRRRGHRSPYICSKEEDKANKPRHQ